MGRAPMAPDKGLRHLRLAAHHKRQNSPGFRTLLASKYILSLAAIFIATWIVIAASNVWFSKGKFVASPCVNDTRLPRPTQSDIAVAASQKAWVKSMPATRQPYASASVLAG